MPKKGDIIKTYRVVRRIGRGSSGEVLLVESVSSAHEEYALKIMLNVAMNEEMKIGLTLSKNCSYLVRFKEVFADDEDIYIVMEYCSGGDLSKRLEEKKPLTDMEIYHFLYDSSAAMKCLHDAGIIHRDIKPSNFFLIPSGGFKLGDYGTARMISLQTMTRIGTDGFISPEIMRGDGKYTSKTDIYSLGITLIHCILGHSPFSASAEAPVNLQLAALGTPVDAVLRHPHPAMKLACRMISVDPATRPTIDEVRIFPFLAVVHIHPLLAGSNKEADTKAQIEVLQKENERRKEIERQRKENERLLKENEQLQKAFKCSSSPSVSSPLSVTNFAMSSDKKPTTISPTATATAHSSPSLTPTLVSRSVLSGEYLNVINDWLGGGRRFNLLYKSSRDGLRGSVFHKKCDGKGATVVIITSSTGCMFGGYAAVSWNSNDGNIADRSKQSFLFSLKNPHNWPPTKFGLKDEQKAIICSENRGPCFGDSKDIYIFSGLHHTSCSTNLGGSYLNPTGLNGTTVFTGQKEFTVADVEVYAVL